MNTEQFLELLAIKGKDYDLFEYRTMLAIIRYCDTDTRKAFFPNAVSISGYDYGYPEIAIKLVCYTIGTIPSYGFNKAVVIKPYPQAVGCLFQNVPFRWNYLFKRFVTDIYAGCTEPAFAYAVFEAASKKPFIIGSLMKMEAQSEWVVRVIFEFIRCFCADRFQEFFNRWVEVAGAEKIGPFQSTDYFSSYIRSDRLAMAIRSEVESAISIQTNHSGKDYDVGEGVKRWLDSWLVAQYGLRSAQKICNHYDGAKAAWTDGPSESGGSGCVSAGTMIALADGTRRRICDMKENDRIFSEGKRISRISDELIVNRRLKRFYGINEIPPFLSFEHAVMTQDGWKSLDPARANAINPHFHVGLLKEGDVAVTFTGTIKIKKITVETALPGEYFTGYDLHVREGWNSYFANEVLVLLNYPEITCSRILRNMQTMEQGERERLLELVNSNRRLFGQAFGIDVMNYLEEGVNEKL